MYNSPVKVENKKTRAVGHSAHTRGREFWVKKKNSENLLHSQHSVIFRGYFLKYSKRRFFENIDEEIWLTAIHDSAKKFGETLNYDRIKHRFQDGR